MRQYNILWFILGLGSALQLVASLSISELICLCLFPIWLVSDIHEIKHHGVHVFLNISFLVVVGCAISCNVNDTPGYFVLRGMAVACLLPCTIVVSHRLLSKEPSGFKYFLVGAAISTIISTFFFQSAVEVTMLAQGIRDQSTADMIISGPLYWISRLQGFVFAPIKGWYLQTPIIYSVLAPLLFGLFAILTSTSGRSSSLISIFSCVLVLIGGKKIKTMRRMSKHAMLLLVYAVLLSFALKGIYQYTAKSGLLGESAQMKYESQTKGKSDMWSLLIGGRVDSFAGYPACFDNPIVGLGPYPIDDKGYYEEFLRRFGNGEDYEKYVRNRAWELSCGMSRQTMVSAHSSIVAFWIQFGIFGLLFWIYAFIVICRYIRLDIASIPNWFGWLVLGIPGFIWNAIFSPFSSRLGVPMLIVACLMARAVRLNKFVLPHNMVEEMQKAEMR